MSPVPHRFITPHRLSFLLVLLAALALYLGNGRSWPSGDTVPARLVPVSILTEHNLDLNEFEQAIHPGKRYCMRDIGGRKLSSYPLGPVFTALPVYAATYLANPGAFADIARAYKAPGYADDTPTAASRLEKASAAIIAALSVAVVWSLCRLRLPLARSALVTLGYGVGTSLMSAASQALWTHGPSCLALTVMFYGLLLQPVSRGWLATAGAAAGWAVFCRPTNALPLLILAPWIVWNCRKQVVWFALGGLVVFGVTGALNHHVYGHFMGGYAGHRLMFSSFSREALAGVLFSPSRGLFVFSPFLLMAVFLGAVAAVRRPRGYAAASLVAAAVYIGIYAFWPDWGGGFSFGPRLLCDVVPFLIVPLVLFFETTGRNRLLFAACGLLLALSCFTHVRGAYKGDRDWNGRIYSGFETERLWQIKDSQWQWTVIGRKVGRQ